MLSRCRKFWQGWEWVTGPSKTHEINRNEVEKSIRCALLNGPGWDCASKDFTTQKVMSGRPPGPPHPAMGTHGIGGDLWAWAHTCDGGPVVTCQSLIEVLLLDGKPVKSASGLLERKKGKEARQRRKWVVTGNKVNFREFKVYSFNKQLWLRTYIFRIYFKNTYLKS